MKEPMTNNSGQALLAPSDIARIAEVSAAAVSNWRKRSADFPEPVGGTPARPLFARGDVISWLKANDKPLVELAESSALAALNLISHLLRDVGVDGYQSARLISSLCAARKLSDEDGAAFPLWQNFLGRVKQEGLAALRQLGHDYEIDRWDDLVEFPNFADRVPPEAAEKVAQLISEIPDAELADAADAVLARGISAKGRAGTENGYIGSRVSTFLARISQDDAHGVVYDPACGIGDALMQIWDLAGEERIDWLMANDVNEDAVLTADQRGYLRDAPLALQTVDVLATNPHLDYRPDLVVVEPPFGLSYDGYDLMDPRWAFGIPPKNSSEFAWIQHVIYNLADQGVGYVVTSGAPLFRGGREAEIRRELVSAGCVRAVYALPAKLLTHTSIPLAVWVVGKPGTTDSVRFVDATSDEVVGGRRGFEEANPSSDVSITDLLAGDVNLVPERWIGLDSPDPSLVVSDYANAVAAVGAAGRAAETVAVSEFKASGLARLSTIRELQSQGVLEVRTGRGGLDRGEVRNPQVVSSGDIARGHLAPVSEGLDLPASDTTAPGDVLVSTTGRLAAVLDELGGHILGMGVVGLRVTGTQLRADYLAAVVAGNWNRRLFTGTALQRVAARDLEIPLLTVEDQRAFAKATADLRRIQELAGQLASAAAEAAESLAEVARFGIQGIGGDA